MRSRSDEALRLENVGRRFRRWDRRPTTLKEAIVRRLRRDRPSFEEFWALEEISLTARRGEVLGFCGANGAGKSTLLKLIARILPATCGRITVRGRIAALLELGTGFLPELSGRENILLNGAILGLGDAEMRRKLDSIVEFAGLGPFIDSPVRTYSAGMYARLGFAIASHVEADILLIDEVLAVGDAAFQKKCHAWLESLTAGDTTVLLVSHSLSTLEALCDRMIWLDRGRVAAAGDPVAVVGRYAEAATSSGPPAPRPAPDAPPSPSTARREVAS